jgi:phage tail sheath protein FI
MPDSYRAPGVYVEEVASGLAPIVGVGTSTAGFIGVINLAIPFKSVSAEAETKEETLVAAATADEEAKTPAKGKAAKAEVLKPETALPTPAGEVRLCTNFTEFKVAFGDFSENPGHNTLSHAVYGFFRNGGTRCYVAWVTGNVAVPDVLERFEAIDEIAIVAAPGVTDKTALGEVIGHCWRMGDRFAVIDAEETITLEQLKPGSDKLPGNSDYAALYHPWIQVFDPVAKSLIYVPPSGHIAGIYARVDDRRGVHKAPANEPILGAVGLRQEISRVKQEPLNDVGVNCIRNLNGNIRVWGARTLGAGKDNPDFKYINIRRQFLYLRESIDEGTQWVVFEPNSPELWARIRRNLTAFLTNEWRKGALLGTTPQEAFFVKCDAENNPFDTRALGQVIAEIGVSIINPAEFVIFRIHQWVKEEKQ